MGPEEATFTLAADWTGVDERSAELANQLLIQVGLQAKDGSPDGFYLTFGESAPPVIFGTDEVKAEQKAGYDGRLPIKPVARVFVPFARLVDFIAALQESISNYETVRASTDAAVTTGDGNG